ncbi:MAG: PHP domain-containing protein [Candidatus Helarchaeota archaeon]
MIIDPHIHTKFSPCSQIGLKDLFNTSINIGLNAIIITDHNILSFQILEKLPNEYKEDLLVLIGEEITSVDGDILAYGIKNVVPQGLTAEKTIELIHAQNGIAIAAHPYRLFHKGYSPFGLGDKIFELNLDAIEGINGGNSIESNRKAVKAAKTLNLPAIGGSDAHFSNDIGKVIMKIPEIKKIEEFIKCVKEKRFRVFSRF